MPQSSPDPSGTFDLLIVGSGIAGLSAGIQAARLGMSVAMATKAELSQGNTRWAQGGVAAVLDSDDSVEEHLADTLAAGGDLCDADAVRVLVAEGPARVRGLIADGAEFDKLASGELSMAREGGHSRARIVHAGGAATGVEIERTLVRSVSETPVILHETTFAVDLLVEDGRCAGILALDGSGVRREILASNTLLAAGGTGQLFAVTTNPRVATGDGIAMALRAGVAVADIEFMQFHPTALHQPVMPRPLLSEAMRGHGALLLDTNHQRFVDELAPRDVVARAITLTMRQQGVPHLWLDATAMRDARKRFPTITAKLDEVGLDVGRDLLPVAPAAHYHCGGVMTDVEGATSLPGLWAAGEVACVGVHGANRLASNSLLDGMVFAHRVVAAIAAGQKWPSASGVLRGVLEGSIPPEIGVEFVRSDAARGRSVAAAVENGDVDSCRTELQEMMSSNAGVLRRADSLAAAASWIEALGPRIGDADTVATWEVRNLATVGAALVRAAALRTETRGSHSRDDHLKQDDAQRVRYVHIGEESR